MDQELHLGIHLMQGSDSGVAVHVGQTHVHDADLAEGAFPQPAQSRGNGFERRHPPAFVLQVGLQVFPNHFLVVDDQDPSAHGSASRFEGRRMLKQAPWPGLELTDNRPLCCSVTMK